jgi:hypothetical protein
MVNMCVTYIILGRPYIQCTVGLASLGSGLRKIADPAHDPLHERLKNSFLDWLPVACLERVAVHYMRSRAADPCMQTMIHRTCVRCDLRGPWTLLTGARCTSHSAIRVQIQILDCCWRSL